MQANEHLVHLGVAEAAEGIRRGDFTSERYTSALLQHARMHSGLNAFVTIDEAAALDAARAADQQRAAGVTAPLLGVPLGIKDSYLTQGLRTSFGLDDFDFVPSEDAHTVSAIRRAGGIVFGKTNLVAMSYGLTGKDSRAGQVRNPHDPTRVSGGSSSGSAAAVGACMVPAALGGDTVGSIRVPASLSGVVGFKPSTGRWPGHGVAPIAPTLESTGVLARSVADCVLLDRVVTGADSQPAVLQGMRFAIAPRQYLDLVAPEIQARFDEVVRLLRAQGARVVEVDLGDDFVPITRSSAWTIFFHETMASIQTFLREHRVPLTFEEVHHHLSPDLHGAWSHLVLPTGAAYFSRSLYEAATAQRQDIQRRLGDAFHTTGAEAFLLPTTPCTAPLIHQQDKFLIAGQEVDYLALANNTVAANLAGLPGISLPAGCTSAGLPMGLELDGPYGADSRLLEVARLLEPTLKQL